MQTRVTSQSQPYRLRHRLEEAGVAHGEEIRADLTGVRVTAAGGTFAEVRQWFRPESKPAAGDVFFCTMGRVRVREILQAGDRRPLPDTVELEGLEVPTAGDFDILNALVQSNGRIRVVVDRETSVVASEPAVLT